MNPEYYVSHDKALLDLDFVVRELQLSYWGGNRTKAQILKSIDHSLCFGMYELPHEDKPTWRDAQVGFARVVTDYATFAWVCDILIMESLRKKGLGKLLMATVMNHPEVKPRACLLTTGNMHKFYGEFGFISCIAMKRVPEGGGE
jgi:GNAT superfamily N-acetyltransferase